ncbi:hypothetical protein OEZ85_003797 [Tetradesmus obliquus]|uniref:Uncharacterized protein n=1 Tax=Tetradesmus obliquus TaxID=3088 RepID=A0ABY8UCF2_TETOB|nr:hypothetical protein OEZ85_003797 [Tetradesmus obliquus]
MRGISKQLLAAGVAAPLQQEALQLGAAACTALRLQAQQAWMHSPAAGTAAARSHSYHGSRDDEDSSSSSSSKDGAAPKGSSTEDRSSSSSSSSFQATEQFKALKEALEQATESWQAGQHAREASMLPAHVARIAMRDPLGMLMTSRGVPLGISLKVNPDKVRRQQQAAQSEREAAADKRDWQELIDQYSSRTSSHASSEDSSTSVPSTDAQLLRAKLVKTAQKLVNASRASRFNSSKQHSHISSSSAAAAVEAGAQEQQGKQQQEQEVAADDASADSQEEQQQQPQQPQQQQQRRRLTVGKQAMLQLEQLLSAAAAGRDSYGTTQESAAEIAQQIADSNKRAAGDGGDGEDGSDGDDDGEEELSLRGGEGRCADESAVAAELKEMDEIYEVLAKVPWLNDDDVEERELRGLVAVGLLGTLEEVGWQLRQPLLALWGGERDLDALTEGVGPREAAALTMILYHTEQLEHEFGGPAAAGVAAALKAARGVPGDAGDKAAAAAMAAVAGVADELGGGEKQ